ncbi:Uncharacterised protein [Serratia quinivorans]|uniref:Uncharacterized protein n=1 Tax=Serratia quinivorans TaxID=137545 RepID=A0A379YGB0_9GAMM|nr:Uncharacterised protein [Serratia quinivorans]SUI44195.1 Uncharacterised protein [Serratia quinivorans]
MQRSSVEPHCPKCKIVGSEYIAYEPNETVTTSENLKFEIAYCSCCGYVHGVFAEILEIQPVCE